MIGSLGFKFEVNQADIVGALAPRVAFNPFDEHGLLLGLPRLRGENNVSYKRRLLDVFVHRANSTYNGLIYGMTRDLGLELFYAIHINPKLLPSGNFICADPLIKFDGIYLYLYSDYYNGILDYQIDRYEPGGNWEHLTRLVTYINQSAHWEATIATGVDPWTRSMTIMQQTNRVYVPLEAVPVTNHFQLENYPLAKHTVFFSDRTIFDTEVESASDVTESGEYWIDYTQGLVFVYDLPLASTVVRYEYYPYPFKALASPIILCDINNTFRRKMFRQELQDDNTYVDSTIRRVGADILHELYSVYPAYFGA